jgi:hypothetical protein
MWGPLEDTRRHIDKDYHSHLAASGQEFRSHRRLGIVVVIATTVVGTSVFGALTQGTTPSIYVQIGTGLLAVLAAVLSAVQTFYAYDDRSKAHIASAMEFYSLKREIDMFFQRYSTSPPHGGDEERESNKDQRDIQKKYAEAKARAPIIAS